MKRTGKYKNFPELKAGDFVVCGNHTAYIVTGEGGYSLKESLDPTTPAVVDGFVDNMECLFADCNIICSLPELIPEAVFRPLGGLPITTYSLKTALRYWRSVNTAHDGRLVRVWSIDDDNAKELTVDEVSKLLGYKVKIVGSDKMTSKIPIKVNCPD